MLAGVAVVLKIILGVPRISERVGGVVKRILLRLRVLLRVKVLEEEEVFKGEVVREQSYTDIKPS